MNPHLSMLTFNATVARFDANGDQEQYYQGKCRLKQLHSNSIQLKCGDYAISLRSQAWTLRYCKLKSKNSRARVVFIKRLHDGLSFQITTGIGKESDSGRAVIAFLVQKGLPLVEQRGAH